MKLVRNSKVLALVVVIMLLFVTHSYAMMGSGPGTGTMGAIMQMPTAQEMFSYGPTTTPVIGADVATMMPIGVGTIATGGNMVTLQMTTGQFAGAMDMYFAVFAPSVDPFNVYLLHQDGSLQPASMGIAPWMSGVTGLDQTLFSNIPSSQLPKGTYYMGLMAAPAGNANMSAYYMWTTNFVIQ